MDIINLFVVGNKLGKDGFFFDVPNGACGINGTGPNQIGYLRIPVEGCKRCTEFVVVFEVKLQFNRGVVFDFPDFKSFSRSGQ